MATMAAEGCLSRPEGRKARQSGQRGSLGQAEEIGRDRNGTGNRDSAGSVTMEAELANDTKAADAIWEAPAHRRQGQPLGRGDLFLHPGPLPTAQSREVVEVGDLAYWPPGSPFVSSSGRPGQHRQ